MYKRQLVERAEMGQFLRSQRGVAHPIQREDHCPRFFAHRVRRRNIGQMCIRDSVFDFRAAWTFRQIGGKLPLGLTLIGGCGPAAEALEPLGLSLIHI